VEVCQKELRRQEELQKLQNQEERRRTKTVIDNAKTEYLEGRCDQIMKFQGVGIYG
jgi:hypothetical protein